MQSVERSGSIRVAATLNKEWFGRGEARDDTASLLVCSALVVVRRLIIPFEGEELR